MKSAASPVPVSIFVDEGNDKIIVSPASVHISASKNEEIVWMCAQGKAVIVFPGDSPFHDYDEKDRSFQAPRGGAVHTGKVTGADKKRHDPYLYTVEVEIDGTIYKRDPEVVVDP
jgi:hypothetical protein